MNSQPKKLDINPDILAVQYAVRGKTFLKAQEIQSKIKEAKAKGQPNPYPFEDIVYCNIGNPQLLNQKPLTYLRQVISIVEDPSLLELKDKYPKDILEHAKALINSTGCIGTSGAYTDSRGLMHVRQKVCEFLKETEGGIETKPEDVYLTDGASPGIKLFLNLLISHHMHGIMIPIPQYPLYSAAISQFGGTQVNYYLNEDDNWAIDLNSVEKSYKEAVSKGIIVKAFVVINPGNPTGQVMTLQNMQKIIEFCYNHNLVLMADEVYQENIYGEVPWTPFRKALDTMSEEIKKGLILVTFFSVSKGFYGECGKRGGFFRMVNVGEYEKEQIYKLSSVNLCSNVVGQEAVELVVNRPKEGDESYPLFKKEKDQILNELKMKANIIRDALIQCEGITCNPAMGALYLFPCVKLPNKFIEECNKKGVDPDVEYCLLMLEKSGVCVVPGNGFGQKENTHHFRIAFLPPLEAIKKTTDLIQNFQKEFMDKYRDN